jgi:hypothetical protein
MNTTHHQSIIQNSRKTRVTHSGLDNAADHFQTSSKLIQVNPSKKPQFPPMNGQIGQEAVKFLTVSLSYLCPCRLPRQHVAPTCPALAKAKCEGGSPAKAEAKVGGTSPHHSNRTQSHRIAPRKKYFQPT